MNAVANEILNGATLLEVYIDYQTLKQRYKTVSKLSCVGNLVCDYFTLDERLHTGLKGGVSFYDFINNWDTWKHTPGVWRMYNEAPYTSHLRRMRNAYKMYIGTCTIFKPLQTLTFLETLPCNVAMLDPCAGWGGRLVGSCVKNIPRYIGIENNRHLEEPYSRLIDFLRGLTRTEIEMYYQDALTVDYSKFKYDLVLTSPPYFNLEKYRDMALYRTKREWMAVFYEPLFRRIFESLCIGGCMGLNVTDELYRQFVLIFGNCSFRIPMDTRGRNQKYQEYLYVWVKKQNSLSVENTLENISSNIYNGTEKAEVEFTTKTGTDRA